VWHRYTGASLGRIADRSIERPNPAQAVYVLWIGPNRNLARSRAHLQQRTGLKAYYIRHMSNRTFTAVRGFVIESDLLDMMLA